MNARLNGRKFGNKHARALTLTEVLILIGTVALLAALFLPSMPRRPYAPRITCANNLKQVGLAFRTYAIDNDGHFPMQGSATNGGTMEFVGSGQVFLHFQVMSNELSTPRILFCDADQERKYATTFARGFTDQNLSYFVNMDAIPESSSTLLCGDRNLTNQLVAGSRLVGVTNSSRIGWTKEIHSKWGNLCFADGRVAGVANGQPPTVVRLPEGVTNRLAIP